MNKIQQEEEMTQEVEPLLSDAGSAGTTSNGHLDTITEEEEEEEEDAEDEENATRSRYNAKDIYRKVRIIIFLTRV